MVAPASVRSDAVHMRSGGRQSAPPDTAEREQESPCPLADLPQAGQPDRTADQRSDEERDDAEVTKLNDPDRLAAVVLAAGHRDKLLHDPSP
jgi:hypothetical protein